MVKLKWRMWQREFISLIAQLEKRQYLASAGVGTGKTKAVIGAIKTVMDTGQFDRVVIVAPQAKVKSQFVIEAAAFGIHLDASGKNKSIKAILKDFHGLSMTYAGLGFLVGLESFITEKTVVVLDEVHHLAECEDSVWYKTVRDTLSHAGLIISLTGTPYNKDDRKRLPFCTYRKTGENSYELQPDFVYTFGQAVRDNVVCNPSFIFQGGKVVWSHNGKIKKVDLDHDSLTEEDESRAIRTLIKEGEPYQEQFLAASVQKLREIRTSENNYGMLVCCTDIKHAAYISGLLSEITGQEVITVTGDDPKAQSLLHKFDKGKQPFLVAVKMVSEGVSIDRIKVISYLSNVTTRLFFEQVLGRAVRKTVPQRERCYMFLPNVPSLRTHVAVLEHEIKDIFIDTEKKDRDGEAPVRFSTFIPMEASTGSNKVVVFAEDFEIDDNPVVKQDMAETLRLECAEIAKVYAQRYSQKNGVPKERIGELIQQIHTKANEAVGQKSQHDMTLAELGRKKEILNMWMNKK